MYINKPRIKKKTQQSNKYFFVPDSTDGKGKITETPLIKKIKFCIRITIITHDKGGNFQH